MSTTNIIAVRPEPRAVLERRKNEAKDPNRLLKQGVWAYFLLLIFEGALRKWFLPGLATPLLIIRDPLVVWMLILTWQRGLLPANPYMIGMMLIGILSTFTAVLVGHGNVAVAIYGARILLLHFPMVFVIGRIFNREDVVKLGKVTLWIAIPMTVLIALQFYSPQSAWVNRGVGGDMAGAGYSGALNYFRPPGTFSFTSGNTQFFMFVGCFVFYFWLNSQNMNRLVLIAATAGLLAAIPMSISRSLLFGVGVTMIFTLAAVARKPQYLSKIIPIGFAMVIALAVLSQATFFQNATEAFLSRFTSASETEGGLEGTIGNRYLGGMFAALTGSSNTPFFGYGIGMGTNVGSMLLSGGTQFLIAEEEWARLIGEMGPLFGIIVIFLRVGFCVKVAFACYEKLSVGDFLPWILLSYGLLMIPQGQWAQPTALGFSTLIAGLLIASLRSAPQKRVVRTS
ncbi:hypothetical protein [uncultured Hymenobacter sp.]|uniref:hypothetical protein n=1 Tax=uncultured Hymenobacter sp. TaxID=170016 RepID=UPI0035CA4BC1